MLGLDFPNLVSLISDNHVTTELRCVGYCPATSCVAPAISHTIVGLEGPWTAVTRHPVFSLATLYTFVGLGKHLVLQCMI